MPVKKQQFFQYQQKINKAEVAADEAVKAVEKTMSIIRAAINTINATNSITVANVTEISLSMTHAMALVKKEKAAFSEFRATATPFVFFESQTSDDSLGANDAPNITTLAV